jgi:hypothetical protein
MARPAVFKRFPSLRMRPADALIVSPELRASCPALEDDFAVLDRELLPRFQELDRTALQAQNQFRLEQVVLILGGVLAVLLGALQGALRDAAWPGVVEALVGGSWPWLACAPGSCTRSAATSPAGSRPSGSAANTSATWDGSASTPVPTGTGGWSARSPASTRRRASHERPGRSVR